jgi:SAM-dependent methyltransferase
MNAARDARCPACGAGDAAYVGANAQVSLVACPACTLVYSHPQPRERVREKYIGQYDLAEHFGALEPRKRELFERRLDSLPAPRTGADRLCDVGTGDGQFLELARARGWRPFGIELNGPAARRAEQRGATMWQGTIEDLPDLPWETFDLVTSWDVLEHTPDPRPFATAVARLLAPGGTLVLTTLNLGSLAYRCFGTRWSMVGEDHFTYWNRRSLTTLFESLGLRVDEVYTFGLGRDFVAFLDRRRSVAAASPKDADASGTHQPAPPARGWDVNPAVLATEAVLNAAFRLFGGGVGLGLRLKRSGVS